MMGEASQEVGVMPKERINGDCYDVQVGWDHDRDVQIGVTSGLDLVEDLYGSCGSMEAIGKALHYAYNSGGFSPSLEQAGRQVLDIVTGVATYNGIWSTLDRDAVNRLIRVLRKARDQAFGADA